MCTEIVDELNWIFRHCLLQWSNWDGNGRGAGRRAAQGSDDREKSFVCQYDQCDKAFFRKDHLIRHQRIKHGKPYGVDTQVVYYCHFADCGRMFYKNASLHRHMNDAHGYGKQLLSQRLLMALLILFPLSLSFSVLVSTCAFWQPFHAMPIIGICLILTRPRFWS